MRQVTQMLSIATLATGGMCFRPASHDSIEPGPGQDSQPKLVDAKPKVGQPVAFQDLLPCLQRLVRELSVMDDKAASDGLKRAGIPEFNETVKSYRSARNQVYAELSAFDLSVLESREGNKNAPDLAVESMRRLNSVLGNYLSGPTLDEFAKKIHMAEKNSNWIEVQKFVHRCLGQAFPEGPAKDSKIGKEELELALSGVNKLDFILKLSENGIEKADKRVRIQVADCISSVYPETLRGEQRFEFLNESSEAASKRCDGWIIAIKLDLECCSKSDISNK